MLTELSLGMIKDKTFIFEILEENSFHLYVTNMFEIRDIITNSGVQKYIINPGFMPDARIKISKRDVIVSGHPSLSVIESYFGILDDCMAEEKTQCEIIDDKTH